MQRRRSQNESMLRAERLVRNQIFWRDVNEQIRAAAARFERAGDQPDRACEFRCECAHRNCLARVALTTAEYEQVRADPTGFLVAPGHEQASIERAVRRTDRFTVVTKFHPEPVQAATEHDPRARQG